MSFFPLFIDISEKNILVIGGGRIALRRIHTLVEFGCRVTVVAPEICEEMKTLTDGQSVKWEKGDYASSFLTDNRPLFVLAAAPAEINERVVADCRKGGIPVNDASRKENCDFYFPGIVKEGETVIGITSGGKDHRLAATLTASLKKQISGLLDPSDN